MKLSAHSERAAMLLAGLLSMSCGREPDEPPASTCTASAADTTEPPGVEHRLLSFVFGESARSIEISLPNASHVAFGDAGMVVHDGRSYWTERGGVRALDGANGVPGVVGSTIFVQRSSKIVAVDLATGRERDVPPLPCRRGFSVDADGLWLICDDHAQFVDVTGAASGEPLPIPTGTKRPSLGFRAAVRGRTVAWYDAEPSRVTWLREGGDPKRLDVPLPSLLAGLEVLDEGRGFVVLTDHNRCSVKVWGRERESKPLPVDCASTVWSAGTHGAGVFDGRSVWVWDHAQGEFEAVSAIEGAEGCRGLSIAVDTPRQVGALLLLCPSTGSEGCPPYHARGPGEEPLGWQYMRKVWR